jgi:hypothetical protein
MRWTIIGRPHAKHQLRRNQMSLRLYVPLSVGVFVLVVAAAHYVSFPIMPFALILLFGETLFGFELEDHKIPRLLAAIFRAPKRRTDTSA